VPNGASQQLECVDKEKLKIKWLQTIYSMERTFTQKQIPRQYERFNL